MFGKPQWFRRRKYGGWGLFPATWQGWAYVAALIIPIILIRAVPGWSEPFRFAALMAWGAVMLIDVIDIMSKLRMDERERLHEAVAERNALWAIIAVLCVGVAYQVGSSVARGLPAAVDPIILAAIGAGLAAKAASNIYLDRRD